MTKSSGVGSIAFDDARLVLAGVFRETLFTTPQGTVEVLVADRGWLPLCSTPSWTDAMESRVLCRQLGYNYTWISDSRPSKYE